MLAMLMIASLPRLRQGLLGKLFGEKWLSGQRYSALLAQQTLELVAEVRCNMKPIQHIPLIRWYCASVHSSKLYSMN